MLACKVEKTKEEEEEEEKKAGVAEPERAANANDEADDFLAKFGSVSFDALVEGSGPNAACSRMEQEFELRLEDLAENPADDGQDVEEHAAEVLKEKDARDVPPWRLIPAATGTEAPPDPRQRMQTPKPSKKAANESSSHGSQQWEGGSSSSHGRHRASEEVRCRPESGPSCFNYGPGTGEHSMHEGKTQRFFGNGHLAFLMIDLHSRMRRFLNL